jgi:hypothetical protein
MQHRTDGGAERPESPPSFRDQPHDKSSSDTTIADAMGLVGGAVNVHAATGLIGSVRRALEEGGCDSLACARVLNLLEQDAVGRDLDNLRILIELARSEKSLVASQQALAAKEAELALLSEKAAELEQANVALVKRANQNRKSGGAEVQEQLQDALNQLQQLRADFEDKKVRLLQRACARHDTRS